MIRLKQISSNCVEVGDGGVFFLFSYETLVGAYNLHLGRILLPQTKHSRTTSKHISKWISSLPVGSETKEVPQPTFDALVAGTNLISF